MGRLIIHHGISQSGCLPPYIGRIHHTRHRRGPSAPPHRHIDGKNSKKKSGKKKDACAMPLQRRIELKLHPSSTLNDLRRDVLASFDVPNAARNAYDVSFLGGFPPRPMSDGKDGDTTINELGIRPNESLIVKFGILDDERDTHEEGSASTTTSNGNNISQQPATSSSSELFFNINHNIIFHFRDYV